MLTTGDRVARKPLFISMFCVFVTSPHQWDVFFVSGRLSGAVKKALTQMPEPPALEEFKNIGYELLIYIRVCFRGTS